MINGHKHGKTIDRRQPPQRIGDPENKFPMIVLIRRGGRVVAGQSEEAEWTSGEAYLASKGDAFKSLAKQAAAANADRKQPSQRKADSDRQ